MSTSVVSTIFSIITACVAFYIFINTVRPIQAKPINGNLLLEGFQKMLGPSMTSSISQNPWQLPINLWNKYEKTVESFFPFTLKVGADGKLHKPYFKYGNNAMASELVHKIVKPPPGFQGQASYGHGGQMHADSGYEGGQHYGPPSFSQTFGEPYPSASTSHAYGQPKYGAYGGHYGGGYDDGFAGEQGGYGGNYGPSKHYERDSRLTEKYGRYLNGHQGTQSGYAGGYRWSRSEKDPTISEDPTITGPLAQLTGSLIQAAFPKMGKFVGVGK